MYEDVTKAENLMYEIRKNKYNRNLYHADDSDTLILFSTADEVM